MIARSLIPNAGEINTNLTEFGVQYSIRPVPDPWL